MPVEGAGRGGKYVLNESEIKRLETVLPPLVGSPYRGTCRTTEPLFQQLIAHFTEQAAH
jgi:hypothetical protein